MTDNTSENESYHGYSVDDEDQPQSGGGSLADDRGLDEPLDEGYSPPEKWSGADKYGNTPLEEELGETLDQRVAQEVPEENPYVEAGSIPQEHLGETEDPRSGRLVEEDEGARDDEEKDLVAEDIGIDGAGAGAEEAAMHTLDGDPGERPLPE